MILSEMVILGKKITIKTMKETTHHWVLSTSAVVCTDFPPHALHMQC